MNGFRQLSIRIASLLQLYKAICQWLSSDSETNLLCVHNAARPLLAFLTFRGGDFAPYLQILVAMAQFSFTFSADKSVARACKGLDLHKLDNCFDALQGASPQGQAQEAAQHDEIGDDPAVNSEEE